jgi:very-short-patch-repair endonuclease
VTSWPRTLLDLGAVADLETVRRALDRAVTLQMFSLNAVVDLLDRHPRRADSRNLRRALALANDSGERTREELERRFALLVERFDLPRPDVNVPLLGYEADALWPRERVVVELDSWTWHGGPAAHKRDHEKSAVFEAAGLDVLRLNYDDVTVRVAVSAERVLRRLRAARLEDRPQ